MIRKRIFYLFINQISKINYYIKIMIILLTWICWLIYAFFFLSSIAEPNWWLVFYTQLSGWHGDPLMLARNFKNALPSDTLTIISMLVFFDRLLDSESEVECAQVNAVGLFNQTSASSSQRCNSGFNLHVFK